MRDYRSDFADFSPTVYLDCAYQGPLPRRAVERIQKAIELKARPDRLEAPEYFDLPNRVRARLARLVGAKPTEIALTTSTTQGVGIVAAGLDLKPGDEVLVSTANFPANLFTWIHLRRKGVVVNVLQPRQGLVALEQVREALTPRTRVLALDWVSYSTGVRTDLAAFGELIHRQGGIFVVDGTQGVGALEVNLHNLPVDAMAVAAYKWLLGPYGTGFAYLSGNLQERLDLPVVNWYAVEGSHEFDALPMDRFTLPREARVFDLGETGNFLNFHGLDASLEFVESVGVSTVTEHCTLLLDRLVAGVRRRGLRTSAAADPGQRSTILGFQAESPEKTAELHRELRARHVAVSLRHGMIRVSPYLYNMESDIDRLLEVLG